MERYDRNSSVPPAPPAPHRDRHLTSPHLSWMCDVICITDDLKHGKGKFEYVNGSWHMGEYRDGKVRSTLLLCPDRREGREVSDTAAVVMINQYQMNGHGTFHFKVIASYQH